MGEEVEQSEGDCHAELKPGTLKRLALKTRHVADLVQTNMNPRVPGYRHPDGSSEHQHAEAAVAEIEDLIGKLEHFSCWWQGDVNRDEDSAQYCDTVCQFAQLAAAATTALRACNVPVRKFLDD